MVIRTIEIDDDLQERIDGHIEEILDDFVDYLRDNPDMGDDFDEYYQAQGCDFVHENADSYTPIYCSAIDGLWYLYGDEFAEAFENAGFEMGDNYKQMAIWEHISGEGFQYQRTLEEQFDEWRAEDEPMTLEDFIGSLKS